MYLRVSVRVRVCVCLSVYMCVFARAHTSLYVLCIQIGYIRVLQYDSQDVDQKFDTLHHTAPARCNALYRATTRYIILHSATYSLLVKFPGHLHHKTCDHCNTLQHTATHCNTLQHTATHCNTLQHSVLNPMNVTTSAFGPSRCGHSNGYAKQYMTLQHTATHCNTLQHTAA